MKKLRNGLTVMMLGFTLATGAEPARAAVHDCYLAVIDECSAAMEGANWYTRWALGFICAGLLVGCG